MIDAFPDAQFLMKGGWANALEYAGNLHEVLAWYAQNLKRSFRDYFGYFGLLPVLSRSNSCNQTVSMSSALSCR